MICAAAYLRAADGDIVPARRLGFDAEPRERAYHRARVRVLVEVPLPREEGEVQVAGVVIDRAASRKPAGEPAPFALEQRDIALRAGVLIATYDHGAGVGPQKESRRPLGKFRRQLRFRRLIEEDIVRIARDDHRKPHRHTAIIQPFLYAIKRKRKSAPARGRALLPASPSAPREGLSARRFTPSCTRGRRRATRRLRGGTPPTRGAGYCRHDQASLPPLLP